MTNLNSDIEEVIKNLKLSEKKSLNNIYLQLTDEKDENTFINLDTGEITKDLSHNNYGLIIKMSIQTNTESFLYTNSGCFFFFLLLRCCLQVVPWLPAVCPAVVPWLFCPALH